MLKEGNRYELHDPTFKEVKQFIESDDTDKNEYIKGEYICVNFSTDLNQHAMDKGIRCAEAPIGFKDTGHSIVAFETVDKGLVYVEPQLDVIIPELKVEQEYWKVVEKCSEYACEAEYDDTIQNILIQW